jgi:dienelactone hydrolase
MGHAAGAAVEEPAASVNPIASYNAADAKDAWTRMLAWFKQNGVA